LKPLDIRQLSNKTSNKYKSRLIVYVAGLFIGYEPCKWLLDLGSNQGPTD